ncbi:MAG TPA: VWA domain-containing protein [Rickettsia endosymbiont of Bembidion lapponicum]|nr:VWA domain-containing protein [Rickettsia endosymbiont of Bembidion lapponicum]
MNNLKANGYTKLYGTIKEALESFKGKIDESSILIVFTDGKDEGTNSNITEKDVVDVTSEVIKNPQFNMYTVGFGQYYNQEFF